ncbi:hypothetical protein JGH11_07420 [Dysgonomonas sp. Marseille-P4677]|uniref:hypothetical protein n=1 Tax=Dysgonomonas sp. Marseille-P4677 TaxID=2364790 RepID=UPI001913FA1B|nr:hypothetical protein [Dysgonomonas sp. Marseille-P4677]MBK5720699.1 hypothetical protein [Dysgonomonas sp. Marseille-P4677]
MKLHILLLLFITLSCSSKTREEQAVSLWKERVESIKPYSELKKEAVTKREFFRKEYEAKVGDKTAQDSILLDAQDYLLTISNDFFTSWYNTPWTFHGHSQTPKEGSIACGYFITTTLRDMGFNIPRIKWAQQASEYLIKKVSTDIKRFYKRPIKEIVDHIETNGEGLYIVGLDCHVGYIYNKNGKMTFVHANYYKPKIGVMSEPLIGHNPLNDSKYRVIGKIFDEEMVKNWILNSPYTE